MSGLQGLQSSLLDAYHLEEAVDLCLLFLLEFLVDFAERGGAVVAWFPAWLSGKGDRTAYVSWGAAVEAEADVGEGREADAGHAVIGCEVR